MPSIQCDLHAMHGPQRAMHMVSKQPHSQSCQLRHLANGGWNLPTQLVVVQLSAASARLVSITSMVNPGTTIAPIYHQWKQHGPSCHYCNTHNPAQAIPAKLHHAYHSLTLLPPFQCNIAMAWRYACFMHHVPLTHISHATHWSRHGRGCSTGRLC